MKQLLLRFDLAIPSDFFLLGEIPLEFTDEYLRNAHVKLQQVVFWEETHKKVHIGKGRKMIKVETRFPQNNNGKLDLENGTYQDKSTYLQVKYSEEVRLSLEVAQVYEGEEIVGRRAVPFDYSNQVLLSIPDYEHQISQEISRVKGLTGKRAPWYVNNRDTNDVWESENVSLLKGVGKKCEAVLKMHHIETIFELRSTTLELFLTYAEKGVSKKKLEQLHKLAGKAKEGSPPTVLVVDHTKASNPYLSLYGEDEWKEKIGKCTHMKKYQCITKLVQHIHNCLAKVMKGKKHKKDWLF